MARRVNKAPTSTDAAAPGFFGHGMSISTLPTQANSCEIQFLKQENEQLRDQLQQCQQLLSIWQQQPCAICQANGGSSTTGTNSNRRVTGSTSTARPSRNSTTASDISSLPAKFPAAGSTGAVTGVQSMLEKAFRQQQVLIAQLQRQVMVLQVELSCREDLLLAAAAVLDESSRRLAALLALQQDTYQVVGGRSSRAAGPQGGLATTNARRSGTAGASNAGPVRLSGVGAEAGGLANIAVADMVIEQVQDLFSWCKDTQGRISRLKAESATKSRVLVKGCSTHNAGSTWQNIAWQADQDCASSLQQLQLQYWPAGGNKYLKPGSMLTLPEVAQGQSSAAVNTAVLQQLMVQLGGLAMPLAELAVQLRSIILPALPWAAGGVFGEQLVSSCAGAAQQAATAAAELVEVCSVLPAGPGVLSAPAAAVARQLAAGHAAAAQEAGSWGALSSSTAAANSSKSAENAREQLPFAFDPEPARSPTGQMPGTMLQLLQGPDQQLLQQVAELLAAQSGIARSSLVVSSSRPSNTPESRQQRHQQQQQEADALVQQLKQRWMATWCKRQLLEQQLGFVARCSAEQAKLVTGLAQAVAAAAGAAADNYDTPAMQQRAEALQLLSKLHRVSLLLVAQRGGDSCAVVLRGLAQLLEQQLPTTEGIPELLRASSAPAIKAAVLQAVTKVLQDFREKLCSAQGDCSRLHEEPVA